MRITTFVFLTIFSGSAFASHHDTLGFGQSHAHFAKHRRAPVQASLDVGFNASLTIHKSSSHKPSSRPSSHTKYQCCKKDFVRLMDGTLKLCNGTPYRFAGLNAPSLLSGEEFSTVDTFLSFQALGRSVTRTYTLGVRGTSPYADPSVAHIQGWDNTTNSWILNEDQFVKMDQVLAIAAQHDGKVIVPFINQGYDDVNSNYGGVTTDLIVARLNTSWTYDEARTTVDFYTNGTMIEAFKTLLTQVLGRVNTVNGVRYGDDPTILAWETGNELVWDYVWDTEGSPTAPPANWTIAIAEHLKAQAPCTLVMDGSYARQDTTALSFHQAVLNSSAVDIISYHYYGDGDTLRVASDSAAAYANGKVFVSGEYGFLDNVTDYPTYLANAKEQPGFGGSLVWSFRPHAPGGGFVTHSEGDDDNYSYHVPGWPNPMVQNFTLPPNWDYREYGIVQAVRQASFDINNEKLPAVPTPNAPVVWINSTSPLKITWQGSAWASSYSIYGACIEKHQKWELIESGASDATGEGNLTYPLSTNATFIRMRGVTLDGAAGKWSNVLQL